MTTSIARAHTAHAMARRVLASCLLFTLLVLPWYATLASAGAMKLRAQTSSATEEKAASAHAATARPGPSIAGTTTTIQGQVALSDPVFNRPIESCAALSSVGTAVHYQTTMFTVNTSGDYAITSVQDNAGTPWDGFIFLFSQPFDPSDALASCIAANDDDGATGLSRIEPIALQTNTNYVLVTTGFGNDDVGSYTNTIIGPGQAQVLATDLSIALTGPDEIPLQGVVDYTLTVSHVAATQLNVLVEMSYPSHLSFASSTCGGGLAGPGLWSATINALPAGAANARQCVVRLRADATQCQITDVSALASGAGQATVNAMVTNHAEQVGDPSFEASDTSLNSPDWTETSDNFGSPLCNVAACGGTGLGTGPRSGQFWAWLGGSDTLEAGSIEQDVLITEEATALRFFTEFPVCDTASGANEFVRALIDGTEVWRADATSPRCNVVGYQEEVVPVTAFADGQSHTLRFESVSGTAGAISNFFIDDVSIDSGPQCAATAGVSNPPQEVTFANRWVLMLIALALVISGIALNRRIQPA